MAAFNDAHLIAGNGATAYVRGLPAKPAPAYQLVHPAELYGDPVNGQVLGHKVVPVGRLAIDHSGQPNKRGQIAATATLSHADREAQPGDRLLALPKPGWLRDFYPQPPAKPIKAHIIAVYGGVTEIGQYDVVSLDCGRDRGLARGGVLGIYQAGGKVANPVKGGSVNLPEVHAGRLLVFKVADKVSFSLVMRAIHVDDVVCGGPAP